MRAARSALRAGHPLQRHVATVDWRQRKVRTLIAELPESEWARRSAGARRTRPALLRLGPPGAAGRFDPGWARWVLARRTIPKSAQEPAELAYYVCAGPAETTFEQLVAVAGGRWRIEECFQAAKNEAGLASYQVSDYTACYRHITLAMLAHAYLSATRATAKKRGSAAGNGQLIALTVPELRRLLNTLVRAPRPDLDPPPTGPGGADDARLKPAPPTTAPEDSHRHNCRCSTN